MVLINLIQKEYTVSKEKEEKKTQAIGFVRIVGETQDSVNAMVMQQNEIYAYADAHNIEIDVWVKDQDHTNSLDRLIEAATRLRKKNINKIIVSSIDRLGRDHRYVSEVRSILSKLGMEIVSARQSSSTEFENVACDNFMQQLKMMICRLDNEGKSEIVKRGLASRARQGYAVHAVPFGYKKTATKGVFEVSADGIALKHLLKLFAAGDMTVEDVRSDFSRIYYKDDSKKLVNKIQFTRIVTNPYYAGYVAHGGQLYDGLHVPLLSKDEYKKLKELLG